MKPACRTIGRERQRLEDIAPNNPISEECWISVPLPPPTFHSQECASVRQHGARVRRRADLVSASDPRRTLQSLPPLGFFCPRGGCNRQPLPVRDDNDGFRQVMAGACHPFRPYAESRKMIIPSRRTSFSGTCPPVSRPTRVWATISAIALVFCADVVSDGAANAPNR